MSPPEMNAPAGLGGADRRGDGTALRTQDSSALKNIKRAIAVLTTQEDITEVGKALYVRKQELFAAEHAKRIGEAWARARTWTPGQKLYVHAHILFSYLKRGDCIEFDGIRPGARSVDYVRDGKKYYMPKADIEEFNLQSEPPV